MRAGIAIGIAGLALMLGAGGTWFVLHEGAKDEGRALPKGSQVFGTVPHIIAPVPQVPLTQDALAAKARELAPAAPPERPPEYKCTPKGDWNDPNCPKAESQVEEPKPVKVTKHKVVHHRVVRRHKAQRRRHAAPARTLKTKWAQPQSTGFSLERLLNAHR